MWLGHGLPGVLAQLTARSPGPEDSRRSLKLVRAALQSLETRSGKVASLPALCHLVLRWIMTLPKAALVPWVSYLSPRALRSCSYPPLSQQLHFAG